MKEEEVKDLIKGLENMENIMNGLSKKIAEAINPINAINAPMLVVLLEDYAEGIKKMSDYSEEAYLALRMLISNETRCNDHEEKTQDNQEKGETIYYGKL